MRIRTKLILITLIGVSVSIVVSIGIASFLINSQNKEQNEERLVHAFDSVEKTIVNSLTELDLNFQNALKSPDWGYFGVLVDSTPVTLLIIDTPLVTHLLKIGLLNKSDYGFYSTFESSKGNWIIRYSQDLEKIVTGNQVIVKGEYGIEAQELKEEIGDLPTADEIETGFHLQDFEGSLFITFKTPYTYTGAERDSGLKPGLVTGYFIFKKAIPFDLKELSLVLGVNINVYNSTGKMIAGEVPMPDLDVEAIRNKNISSMVDKNGERYDLKLKPIVVQEKIVGYLSMGISQSLTSEKVQESVIFLALGGTIILSLVSLVTFFVVVQVVNPLTTSANLLNAIAQQGGDLTQRMESKGNSELADLSQGFNLFIQKVQKIIQKMQVSTDTLATSAEELSTSTTQMNHTAEGINEAISNEHLAIEQGSKTINDMVASLEVLFKKIKIIHEEATKTGEIAIHGGHVVDRTSKTMDSIEENTKKIEGVVQVITEIANQTNLLSLNAAIEAAKAGESGKGFAVVADEVRTLAEKSAQQVVAIRDLVDVTRHSVKTGSDVIAEIQTVFQQIQEAADRVLGNVNDVTKDISNQETSINNVFNDMKQIYTLSEENADSIKEFSAFLSQTDRTTTDLSQLSEQIASSVNEFQV